MTDPIHHIPLDEIDASSLVRDRMALGEEAQAELRHSIMTRGLRLPIEVYALGTPHPPLKYGLISGYRRLATYQALRDLLGGGPYTAIPAFLRTPADRADALTAMVEENEIRADISPWERGLVAVQAVETGVFGTVDEAIDALYPSAERNKRQRIRTFAWLAEELHGVLTDPYLLNARQLLRLAAACRAGFTDVIRMALASAPIKDPGAQWQTLLPILAEAEAPELASPGPTRPGRPRRTLTPSSRHALRIWRERTPDGWCLHFTGRDATSALLDAVFDEIELNFSPG